MTSDKEKLTEDPEFNRLLRQEELILEVTEALVSALKTAELSKKDLAARLGKSKGFISQLLAGGRNLTLRTIADIALALKMRPKFRLCSEGEWAGYAVDSIKIEDWKVHHGKVKVAVMPPPQGEREQRYPLVA